MKVLILSTGQDTGGQGIRIRDGFLRHAPDWQVEVLNTARSPLGYPEQHVVRLGERMGLARKLWTEADVIHLRNSPDGWRFYDRGQFKPTILHHHGSMFRNAHGSYAFHARRAGMVQIASTLDLTMLEPDVEWLPSPYNLDELHAMRQPNQTDTVRIAYFPTSPKIKSMGAFMAAYTRLAQTHPVTLLTNIQKGRIRHMPWADVLAEKAGADIYFDQVTLGYGNNAVEAWGMGIPVIAGVADPAVRDLMLSRFGTVPFMEATEDTIYEALLLLVESPAMRQEYGQLGMAHARRFHDDAVVVDQLKRIYSEAPRTQAVPITGGRRVA